MDMEVQTVIFVPIHGTKEGLGIYEVLNTSSIPYRPWKRTDVLAMNL